MNGAGFRAGLCGLLLTATLAGCGAAPLLGDDSPVAVSAVNDGANDSSAVSAAERRGPGSYRRTSVPPEFLVLMLGVPLIILLL